MRVAVVVQARMGSSRLPGKIMMPLAGKAVLQRVIERVSCAKFDDVVVALPDCVTNDEAAELAKRAGATVVRGDEDDVLSRYLLAAQAVHADAIMRVTADCPLIDPDVLDQMVEIFKTGAYDLVSNARVRTFPRGLDAELFTRASLDAMATEATLASHREHVTPFLYAHPERFMIHDFVSETDLSNWRLTLDTPEDLALLTRIFDLTEGPDTLRLAETRAIVAAHPELLAINAFIEQKEI
jgi:spore coat polysaccharide biosynthesis protein SpsF